MRRVLVPGSGRHLVLGDRLVKYGTGPHVARMITRGDILWLGIASGVSGGLIGGMMLGIGMDLVVNGQPLGWLIMLPGAPASGLVGWIMGRRLAAQLG